MIIVQTPLRVSLFGGGTDFPAFFREEGGWVLTTAIDKYVFVTIKQRFDDLLRIGYTRTEMVETVEEVQHELIREALRKTGIQRGVEITTMSDMPAGTGLGSSSAVTVGALLAMYTYMNESVLTGRLAREACEIEIDILGKPIGVQDQYIAAYGGLRFVRFHPSGEVICERVALDPALKRRLNESFLLFYTGVTRSADTILSEQQSNMASNVTVLRKMKDLACVAYNELQQGNIDAVGYLMHESWALKKSLASKITNGPINAIYDAARAAGALGGKITGAGGGGFMLLYTPYDKREAVRSALAGTREIPFQLEPDGAKVIFDHRR